MTANNMPPREPLDKTADTDFLRKMIRFTAHRRMELEVETLTGAAHGSRTADPPIRPGTALPVARSRCDLESA
jgi:putative transposase